MTSNSNTTTSKYVISLGRAENMAIGDHAQVTADSHVAAAAKTSRADVLLVVVTDVEMRKTREVFAAHTGKLPKLFHIEGTPYYELGVINGARVVMARSEMGTGGLGGSLQTVTKAIHALRPKSIVMLGIAFGVDSSKQRIGDVLVSQQLQSYELSRIGTDPSGELKVVGRGDRVTTSPQILGRFRFGADSWQAEQSTEVRFGLILSGEKLIDNDQFRQMIVNQGHDKAVGGEMEGAGLYVAAQDARIDWIVVKAISDWADGKKSEDRSDKQGTAAQNAAEFVYHVLSLGGFVDVVSPSQSSEEITRLFSESGTEFDLWDDQILGMQLEREETSQIVDWILHGDPKQCLGMLVDQAGSGKTVVMRHVRQHLIGAGVSVLAIKADALQNLVSRQGLSAWLKLREPVEDCVRQLAEDTPVVVLIDQLDALSLSLSRDRTALDILLDTVARLRQIEHVRIVASCRIFDLRNDPRLSAMKVDREFRLQPLKHEQIRTVLDAAGVDYERLLPAHKTLLAVPLHLAVYVKILGDSSPEMPEGFYSLQELYQALWQRHVSAAPESKGRRDALYRLVDAMQSRQETRVPVAALDDFPTSASYLQSVGLIRQERGSWSFFHQTWLDYCHARRFVADGRSLGQEVLRSPQGLFERSQIVQVLAHLRGTNETSYLRELNALLFSEELRTHLRLLILGWLGSLRDPKVSELAVARRLVNHDGFRAQFLSAIAGNEAWFDQLNRDIVPALLNTNSEDLLNLVVRYLGTLISTRTKQVLSYLHPRLNSDAAWDTRIASCLANLSDWHDADAVEILCDLLSRERLNNYILIDVAKSSPHAACRALRVVLDRELAKLFQGSSVENVFTWSHQLFESYPVKTTVEHVTEACPEYAIEHLLPWLVRASIALQDSGNTPTDRYASDSVFSWGWYGEHVYGGALFALAIVKALQCVAKSDPASFGVLSSALAQIESFSVQRVLAHAYLADPGTYAPEIHAYLIGDRRRLDLGDLEDTHYESCRLFSYAFGHGDLAHRRTLEALILNYELDWEKRTLGSRGITQLRFLKSVPVVLLSDTAQKRLREMERKFPGFEPHTPVGVTMGSVGPPIEQPAIERMSNEAWLGAMREYDDSTEWGKPREDILKGGTIELSRAFTERVKTEPDRFYRFALCLPSDISAYYVSAAITGLAESGAPACQLFDVVRQHASRISGEHKRAVIWAVQKRAKEGVPDDILDLMEDWALHDPDPEREFWQMQAGTDRNTYYGGDPHMHGINSNRGAAVNALCHVALSHTPAKVERAFKLLERASADASTAVRSCIIEQLRHLLRHDAERAFAVFEDAIHGHAVLLRCGVIRDFLCHTYRTHFARVQPYIQAMQHDEDRKTREYGAVLACLAAFTHAEANLLAQQAMNGDEALRCGAARVYASNLQLPEREETCLKHLSLLIHDADASVREQAACCFDDIKQVRFRALKPFIREFMASPALLAGARQLIEYMKPVAMDDLELTLEVVSTLTNAAGKNLADIQTAASVLEADLVGLALAVYTHSDDETLKSLAMNRFEELLLLGSYAARLALQDYDRN